MTTRSSGSKPDLIQRLAPNLTVYSYDRRGRGDSGDTQPYAVEREIEDIEAPYNDAPEARQAWREYIKQLTETLAAGRRSDAVALFTTI